MNLKISEADVTGLPEEKKETREKDGKMRIAVLRCGGLKKISICIIICIMTNANTNLNTGFKEFNDLGLCVPHLHYMADPSAKIEGIGDVVFSSEETFVPAFLKMLFPKPEQTHPHLMPGLSPSATLQDLWACITERCSRSEKKSVLLIDADYLKK